jgi:hypothetical protein
MSATLRARSSAFIGDVKGPNHNSPDVAVSVWCSLDSVEIITAGGAMPIGKRLDPIAARNFAALLVRAAEEAEMMAFRARVAEADSKTPIVGAKS